MTPLFRAITARTTFGSSTRHVPLSAFSLASNANSKPREPFRTSGRAAQRTSAAIDGRSLRMANDIMERLRTLQLDGSAAWSTDTSNDTRDLASRASLCLSHLYRDGFLLEILLLADALERAGVRIDSERTAPIILSARAWVGNHLVSDASRLSNIADGVQPPTVADASDAVEGHLRHRRLQAAMSAGRGLPQHVFARAFENASSSSPAPVEQSQGSVAGKMLAAVASDVDGQLPSSLITDALDLLRKGRHVESDGEALTDLWDGITSGYQSMYASMAPLIPAGEHASAARQIVSEAVAAVPLQPVAYAALAAAAAKFNRPDIATWVLKQLDQCSRWEALAVRSLRDDSLPYPQVSGALRRVDFVPLATGDANDMDKGRFYSRVLQGIGRTTISAYTLQSVEQDAIVACAWAAAAAGQWADAIAAQNLLVRRQTLIHAHETQGGLLELPSSIGGSLWSEPLHCNANAADPPSDSSKAGRGVALPPLLKALVHRSSQSEMVGAGALRTPLVMVSSQERASAPRSTTAFVTAADAYYKKAINDDMRPLEISLAALAATRDFEGVLAVWGRCSGVILKRLRDDDSQVPGMSTGGHYSYMTDHFGFEAQLPYVDRRAAGGATTARVASIINANVLRVVLEAAIETKSNTVIAEVLRIATASAVQLNRMPRLLLACASAVHHLADTAPTAELTRWCTSIIRHARPGDSGLAIADLSLRSVLRSELQAMARTLAPTPASSAEVDAKNAFANKEITVDRWVKSVQSYVNPSGSTGSAGAQPKDFDAVVAALQQRGIVIPPSTALVIAQSAAAEAVSIPVLRDGAGVAADGQDTVRAIIQVRHVLDRMARMCAELQQNGETGTAGGGTLAVEATSSSNSVNVDAASKLVHMTFQLLNLKPNSHTMMKTRAARELNAACTAALNALPLSLVSALRPFGNAMRGQLPPQRWMELFDCITSSWSAIEQKATSHPDERYSSKDIDAVISHAAVEAAADALLYFGLAQLPASSGHLPVALPPLAAAAVKEQHRNCFQRLYLAAAIRSRHRRDAPAGDIAAQQRLPSVARLVRVMLEARMNAPHAVALASMNPLAVSSVAMRDLVYHLALEGHGWTLARVLAALSLPDANALLLGAEPHHAPLSNPVSVPANLRVVVDSCQKAAAQKHSASARSPGAPQQAQQQHQAHVGGSEARDRGAIGALFADSKYSEFVKRTLKHLITFGHMPAERAVESVAQAPTATAAELARNLTRNSTPGALGAPRHVMWSSLLRGDGMRTLPANKISYLPIRSMFPANTRSRLPAPPPYAQVLNSVAWFDLSVIDEAELTIFGDRESSNPFHSSSVNAAGDGKAPRSIFGDPIMVQKVANRSGGTSTASNVPQDSSRPSSAQEFRLVWEESQSATGADHSANASSSPSPIAMLAMEDTTRLLSSLFKEHDPSTVEERVLASSNNFSVPLKRGIKPFWRSKSKLPDVLVALLPDLLRHGIFLPPSAADLVARHARLDPRMVLPLISHLRAQAASLFAHLPSGSELLPHVPPLGTGLSSDGVNSVLNTAQALRILGVALDILDEVAPLNAAGVPSIQSSPPWRPDVPNVLVKLRDLAEKLQETAVVAKLNELIAKSDEAARSALIAAAHRTQARELAAMQSTSNSSLAAPSTNPPPRLAAGVAEPEQQQPQRLASRAPQAMPANTTRLR